MKLVFSKSYALMFSLFVLLGVCATEAPTWIVLFTGSLFILKLLIESRHWSQIPRKITTLLAFFLLLQIYLEFRSFIGQAPSTSLLMGLTAIKILDYENKRDHKYLVILGFLLVCMKPLFSLDLYWMPFLLGAFAGLWWSMLSPTQPRPIRFLVRLFYLSLPIAVILFIIFPRLALPWAKKIPISKNQIGFSEDFDPAATDSISPSDELVFRVRFKGNAYLPHQKMYWRGAVLTQSQGLSWSMGSSSYKNKYAQAADSSSISYEVFLEPGNKKFIFSLETPLLLSGDSFSIYRLPYNQYRTESGSSQVSRYVGVSQLDLTDKEKPSSDFLQTPLLGEKTKQWLKPLLALSEKEKLHALSALFTKNGFSYSLNPGTYTKNPLDDFLFVRKLGFCQHFAAAYATLARALGIPSRVIAGYQGGVFNDYGDFWKITSRDAHAWVEVYTQGEWQRMDPTAMVAPLRIQVSAKDFERETAGNTTSFRNQLSLLIDRTSNLFENINYQWTSFLLNFDKSGQKTFWNYLKDNPGWAVLYLCLILLSMSFVFRWSGKTKRQESPQQRLVQEVYSWGKTNFVPLDIMDTPSTYFQKLATRYPNLQKYLQDLERDYSLVHYQNASALKKASELRKSWERIVQDF